MPVAIRYTRTGVVNRLDEEIRDAAELLSEKKRAELREAEPPPFTKSDSARSSGAPAPVTRERSK